MLRNRFRLTIVLLSLAGIYACFGLILTGPHFLEVTRAGMLCLALGAAAGYWRFAKNAFKPKAPLDEVEVTSLGWFLITLSVSLWCGWYLFWKSIGSPDLWWDEYLLSGFAYMTSVGCILLMLIPRSDNGIVPTKEWVRLAARATIGVACVLCLIYFFTWYYSS